MLVGLFFFFLFVSFLLCFWFGIKFQVKNGVEMSSSWLSDPIIYVMFDVTRIWNEPKWIFLKNHLFFSLLKTLKKIHFKTHFDFIINFVGVTLVSNNIGFLRAMLAHGQLGRK